MDNITPNKKIGGIVKFLDYVFVIVGLIADILGILSFILSFFPSLPQLPIANQFNWYIIVLIVLVNIALLLKLYSHHVKKTHDMGHKTELLIDGLDKISSEFENYFYYMDSKIEQTQSTAELYGIVAESSKGIVDLVESVLRKVTTKDVRACIKYFPKQYNDIKEMQLITLCRSDESLNDSRTEHTDFIHVQENTDFESIMIGENHYFAFNDLMTFKKQTGKKYKNSSEDWTKRYNATIVHPIKRRTERRRRKDYFDILGFLCVDSLSLEAFSGDTGPMCIKFTQSVSRLLYIFLDKCTVQNEKIISEILDVPLEQSDILAFSGSSIEK